MAKLNRRPRWRGPALGGRLQRGVRFCFSAIVTAYGVPFSIKGFGQFMSDAIRKAGLPPYCKAHGLRKAAARRLAEAGCSAHEIMAVTGHKTPSEVERYTRAAEQERLNAAAMAKQLENKKSGKLAWANWQTH